MLNPITKLLVEEVGEFDYDKYDLEYDFNSPIRGPFRFRDYSVY